jgi:nucleotide-binding universal stress UspA family protein
MTTAESVGLIGHPADAIIDEAVRCGADAVVVSPHQHGWIDRLFHRSVADEIQKLSPLPVIVVPAAD